MVTRLLPPGHSLGCFTRRHLSPEIFRYVRLPPPGISQPVYLSPQVVTLEHLLPITPGHLAPLPHPPLFPFSFSSFLFILNAVM